MCVMLLTAEEQLFLQLRDCILRVSHIVVTDNCNPLLSLPFLHDRLDKSFYSIATWPCEGQEGGPFIHFIQAQ